jgi:type II secretory ATPase GspE/PulE/Tfp pilus assembly ATPase PilB-like protein
LAGLFFETGMIDAETFRLCTRKFERDSKSIMEVLKQDVSLKSIRELQNVAGKSVFDILTMEIPLPFLSKPDKKSRNNEAEAVLTQPFYLTNEEIVAILEKWKPDLDAMIHTLVEAGGVIDDPAQLRASLGKGKGVYRRLVEGGHLSHAIINNAINAPSNRLCRTSRLLLCLKLLQHNEIVEETDVNKILTNYVENGPESIPMLNEEIVSFIDSEPEMPEMSLEDHKPGEDIVDLLPLSFIRQNLFIPYQKVLTPIKRLELVMTDPFYVDLTDTLAFLTGVPVVGYYAPEQEIVTRINAFFRPPQDSSVIGGDKPRPEALAFPEASERVMESPSRDLAKTAQAGGPEKVPDNASAVELVSGLVQGGVKSRATDIHIEPREVGVRVRYRIDGRLRKIMEIPPPLVQSVTSRIKVLANLDVTERRRPQDGHFSLRIGSGAFDFRVSTLPTHLGEKTVIRILDESRVMLTLPDLGMEKKQADTIHHWIAQPHGLVLVTGPTGSGKTSTLYAALNTVNSEEKNIVTIEDPVEYRLDGINQVNVDLNFDLNFAEGLRSILRQDPDVIMVGEIRDPDTARIAMRSALTGHLVFSTLHTNTAAGAIATLCNMGIEPYMLTSAITGVVNQRLVRRLCDKCKKPFTPDKAIRDELGVDAKSRKRMWKAGGCDACLGSGYYGRVGVFEVMGMTDPLVHAIVSGRSESDLVEIIRESGESSLMQNAVDKVFAGVTSPQEILETLGAE